MTNSLEYYLGLSYPIELIEDAEQGGYVARHPDLDGCMAQGETADEAVASLKEARMLWIETRLTDGLVVPEPLPEEPSGRLLLRMAPWLHARLMRQAQRQNVSLNQYLIAVLAEHVGRDDQRCDVMRRLASIEDSLNELRTWPQSLWDVSAMVRAAFAGEAGAAPRLYGGSTGRVLTSWERQLIAPPVCAQTPEMGLQV